MGMSVATDTMLLSSPPSPAPNTRATAAIATPSMDTVETIDAKDGLIKIATTTTIAKRGNATLNVDIMDITLADRDAVEKDMEALPPKSAAVEVDSPAIEPIALINVDMNGIALTARDATSVTTVDRVGDVAIRDEKIKDIDVDRMELEEVMLLNSKVSVVFSPGMATIKAVVNVGTAKATVVSTGMILLSVEKIGVIVLNNDTIEVKVGMLVKESAAVEENMDDMEPITLVNTDVMGINALVRDATVALVAVLLI